MCSSLFILGFCWCFLAFPFVLFVCCFPFSFFFIVFCWFFFVNQRVKLQTNYGNIMKPTCFCPRFLSVFLDLCLFCFIGCFLFLLVFECFSLVCNVFFLANQEVKSKKQLMTKIRFSWFFPCLSWFFFDLFLVFRWIFARKGFHQISSE